MTIKESRRWCEEHGLSEQVFDGFRDYLELGIRGSVLKEVEITWWDK